MSSKRSEKRRVSPHDELTTNAAKHGSLSSEAGRLRVRWDVESGPSGEPMMWLRWAEAGGPPVKTPVEFGFGTQLIKSTVEYDLHGDYEAAYPVRGFRCEITFPRRALVPPQDETRRP